MGPAGSREHPTSAQSWPGSRIAQTNRQEGYLVRGRGVLSMAAR